MCVCEKECALSQFGYHYGQFTKEHLEAIKEGILLFNEQAYYECHEALEDLWLSDVGDNARLVYWAIIQVAAAMIHFREDNVIGARGLIKKAKDKFDRCEKHNVETPLLNQYLSWDNLKDMVRKIDNDADLDAFTDLFNFRFSDPKNWEVS